VQDGGAILKADVALRIMRARAGTAWFRRRPISIAVQMACWCAPKPRRFSLSAPFWPSVLEVTRQAVGLFMPARPETLLPGRFPLFILERGLDDVIYGFPDFEQRGVKAAPHNHGPTVDADDWDPPATDVELMPVGNALAKLVPGAAGPIIDRDICLYTNTLPADRRPDKGKEFIIDQCPNSRLIVASPCSGHGASPSI
jgi:sarcosine oxidase